MKKKICVFVLLVLGVVCLSACGKSKLNLNDYLIEKRENLFTACDNLYSVSFSTGEREENFNLDGQVNSLVPFGILTLTRNDNQPLANDEYSYMVTIGDNTMSGFLTKGLNDNSYSADLEISTLGDEIINVKISFTGYTFNKDLENVSNEFQVDTATALKIAEKELKENINNLLSDKNVKIEVVMKVLKDYSNEELKNYYWYVGVVSTDGETLGILIDSHNGDIIAKKV